MERIFGYCPKTDTYFVLSEEDLEKSKWCPICNTHKVYVDLASLAMYNENRKKREA